MPDFELRPFRAEPDAPENPFLKTVCRKAKQEGQKPMAIAVVSSKYSLLTHAQALKHCLDALGQNQIDTSKLKAECQLSELGEWMHLSIYLPKEFNYRETGGEEMALRLECFNSVNGSSRFKVLFGWFRFVCENGLIIGETKAEFQDTHDEKLDLRPLPVTIRKGLIIVKKDVERMAKEELQSLNWERLPSWIDGSVSDEWGKKAASRIFSICNTGWDSELKNPFQAGAASNKETQRTDRVPGAKERATTIYDVAQAMAWVSTHVNDLNNRTKRQLQIRVLLKKLAQSENTTPTKKNKSKFSDKLIKQGQEAFEGLF